MARLTNDQIFKIMAQDKVEMHKDDKWNEIPLWSAFLWSDISRLLKAGKLKTNMHKSNKVLWVRPTCETYLLNIEPLVKELEAGPGIPTL